MFRRESGLSFLNGLNKIAEDLDKYATKRRKCEEPLPRKNKYEIVGKGQDPYGARCMMSHL